MSSVAGIRPNNVLSAIALGNLKAMNDLKYDEAELQFAVKIQETLDRKPALESVAEAEDRGGTTSNGSTDVGDAADFGVVVDQIAGEDAQRGVHPGDRVRPKPHRHLVQVVGQRRCQLGCTIGDPGPVGGSPSVAAVVPGRD